MIYIRGHRLDFDRWAAAGNQGWSHDELLPYFKRSEHFEPGTSPWHGQHGELNVAEQRSPSPVNQVFYQAATELGWSYNPDFNGPEQEGFGPSMSPRSTASAAARHGPSCTRSCTGRT
ncbi:hypothetical protein PBOI14_43350 [Pseudomonas sp. Boi14]|nr:hypothetical protein PBOI14_43350 [Pseudomonas sp. Boi14]